MSQENVDVGLGGLTPLTGATWKRFCSISEEDLEVESVPSSGLRAFHEARRDSLRCSPTPMPVGGLTAEVEEVRDLGA